MKGVRVLRSERHQPPGENLSGPRASVQDAERARKERRTITATPTRESVAGTLGHLFVFVRIFLRQFLLAHELEKYISLWAENIPRPASGTGRAEAVCMGGEPAFSTSQTDRCPPHTAQPHAPLAFWVSSLRCRPRGMEKERRC